MKDEAGPIAKLGALASNLIIARRGPLTQELDLVAGGHGLGQVPTRLKPDATVTTVCGFCSTGCGLQAHLKQGEALNLSAATDYPVNLGMACPKGWEALAPLKARDRGTTPLVRGQGGKLEAASWEQALGTMVARFRAIQKKHGPEAVAWIGTGQLVSEELMLLGALGKFGMSMVHGDGNTRQCMATSVVAYKQSFGFDAPPFSYADFEQSDVIVLVGSNLCIAHPILWERICRNPHQPSIVVIDPRSTETANAATHHYAIRPKSDLVLLYALARYLIEHGFIDERYVAEHTSGFEAFRAHVERYTLEFAEAESGIKRERIEELARLIHHGQRVSFWWTMGVNQSHQAVRTAQAIINLALMTGNIGRPGTGANSITGQCNAMGSRLFSNTTNLLGGRDFTNPEHRRAVADILDIDERRIPDRPSLAYDQILEQVLAGKIKGLWVIGTNPAHSWINQNYLKDVVSRLDCLVVQDMYSSTETVQLAHVYLPAAGWGEKEGTFINSERRVGLTAKVARAPGQALSDFHIFRLVAEAWGVGDMFRAWSSPEKVFQLMKAVSRGQPCDMTGIEDYAMLAREGGVQWPLPEGTPLLARERRLFEDGRYFHEDGKARFLFENERPLPEPTNEQYPFLLLSGRGSSAQWHTQTRTKKSAILRKLSPSELYVEVSPADARRLGIAPDEKVAVISQRARIQARAFVTHSVQPGQLFMPMHYETMNRLTFPAFDPYSRQPAYKACAVSLERLGPGSLPTEG